MAQIPAPSPTRGVWTALVTPFKSDLSVDLEAFKRLLRDQREAGVAGVIPCGTTGESPTLSEAEKKTLIETALREMEGSPTRVFAGTGSNDTATSVDLSRWAAQAGAHGVLVVTPYYNRPTHAGMLKHYFAIAEAVSGRTCEVMVYNVPGRTGVSLAAPTITALAEHPSIRSLKEATGNTAFASEVLWALREAGRSIQLLSGDDATYLSFLAVGGVGCVSVASNLFPRAMVTLQKAFEAGDLRAARALHDRYYPLFRDLFVESNPGPIKAALASQGRGMGGLRPPLADLTPASRETLARAIQACGLQAGVPA